MVPCQDCAVPDRWAGTLEGEGRGMMLEMRAWRRVSGCRSFMRVERRVGGMMLWRKMLMVRWRDVALRHCLITKVLLKAEHLPQSRL